MDNIGSFTCTCEAGYEGDGVTCSKPMQTTLVDYAVQYVLYNTLSDGPELGIMHNNYSFTTLVHYILVIIIPFRSPNYSAVPNV